MNISGSLPLRQLECSGPFRALYFLGYSCPNHGAIGLNRFGWISVFLPYGIYSGHLDLLHLPLRPQARMGTFAISLHHPDHSFAVLNGIVDGCEWLVQDLHQLSCSSCARLDQLKIHPRLITRDITGQPSPRPKQNTARSPQTARSTASPVGPRLRRGLRTIQREINRRARLITRKPDRLRHRSARRGDPRRIELRHGGQLRRPPACARRSRTPRRSARSPLFSAVGAAEMTSLIVVGRNRCSSASAVSATSSACGPAETGTFSQKRTAISTGSKYGPGAVGALTSACGTRTTPNVAACATLRSSSYPTSRGCSTSTGMFAKNGSASRQSAISCWMDVRMLDMIASIHSSGDRNLESFHRVAALLCECVVRWALCPLASATRLYVGFVRLRPRTRPQPAPWAGMPIFALSYSSRLFVKAPYASLGRWHRVWRDFPARSSSRACILGGLLSQVSSVFNPKGF